MTPYNPKVTDLPNDTLPSLDRRFFIVLQSEEPKSRRMNCWEIIADNLSKAGWNCGGISSTDQNGDQFWVVAAEREDAGRFIVEADDNLTGFLEIDAAIHKISIDSLCRRLPEPDSR